MQIIIPRIGASDNLTNGFNHQVHFNRESIEFDGPPSKSWNSPVCHRYRRIGRSALPILELDSLHSNLPNLTSGTPNRGIKRSARRTVNRQQATSNQCSKRSRSTGSQRCQGTSCVRMLCCTPQGISRTYPTETMKLQAGIRIADEGVGRTWRQPFGRCKKCFCF